jgi:two-component system sensor histidine kinase VicK
MNGTLPQSDLTRNESLRLKALEEYRIADSSSNPALDDLAELAAKVCNAPVAGISFATHERILIHARYGMHELELPPGALPGSPPFRSHSVYEIPDARSHTSFAPDGISISGRAYGFYAGAPLITPAGIRIGALFLLDTPPRRLTPFQSQTLATLGRQAMTVIELRHSMQQMESINRSCERIETALTVERNFVSTVLDTVDALVAVFDPVGRIVRFNRACEAASGYDFPTLVGRFIWDKLIPHSDVATAQENFARLRSEAVSVAFENQWVHRDGGIRRIAWSASPLLDEHGQVSFIIATGIDVTIQRAAEATLRESEARYRQLVEGSLGMVCTHDLSGTVLSVNTHGAQSIGLQREDMVGHRLSVYMAEKHRPGFETYLADILRDGEIQGTMRLQHVNGEERVIAYRNKLIEITGRDPYVLGFGIDITERVRAEEKLRNLSRQSNSVLESVGDGIFGLDLEGRVTVVNPAASQMLGFKPQ